MRILPLFLFLAAIPAAATPGDVLVLLQNGEISADEAARRWTTLAEVSGSVQARLHLARLEAGRGAPEQALEHLRRALEIAPNAEDVLDATARLALTTRAPVLAIRMLEPLTRMHPAVPDYAYLLGVARLQAGDPAAAEEALRQAIERRAAAPSDPSTRQAEAFDLSALGLVLNQRNRFDEARRMLEESLLRSPGEIETRAALAEALEGANELGEAERQASRVLEESPDHPAALLVVGMIRMKQKRWDDARDALRVVVEARPDHPKAHYQLSLAWARLGDAEKSRRHRELHRRALDQLAAGLAELRGTTTGERP